MHLPFRAFIFPFLLLLLQLPAMATRISGKVLNEQQEPMAFLTVFIKGTTIGTTTNLEGEYFLDLQAGNYELVFRFFRGHYQYP